MFQVAIHSRPIAGFQFRALGEAGSNARDLIRDGATDVTIVWMPEAL